MIININDRNGKGDGKTLNTSVIQSCIDECHLSGGGVVQLGTGIYLCGGIYLKNNVTLEIPMGATLLANPDISDYGDDTHYQRYQNEHDLDRCWIYAQDSENISVCGLGTIDGNAQAFPNYGSIYRPMMFRFLHCKHIRIEGLKLYNAASWTTAFLDSSFIWTTGLDIRNHHNYNGDGLDFDGCNHVFVDNCYIQGTDDNLCLQSSSKDYIVENINITNCTFSSICAAIRIGLKSIGTIRNVVISNCAMQNVWKEGIKIECSEGGAIEDIVVNGIVMRNVSKPIYLMLNNKFDMSGLGNSISLTEIPAIGEMRRIIIQNVIATDDEVMKEPKLRFGKDLMGSAWFNGIRIDANENKKIKDVTLSNIRYRAIGGVTLADIPANYPDVYDLLTNPQEMGSGNYYPDWSRTAFMDIRCVDGLYLSNVAFENNYADERPPYFIEKCHVIQEEVFVKEEV